MTNPMTKPIQLQADSTYQVIMEASCTGMKVVQRDGRYWAMKFFFSNGAILYVPMPDDRGTQDDQFIETSAGPMTA